MATYRGSDGLVHQGGATVGTPLVQGAVAQGVTSATLDGADFNGVVRPGDTFTVAGDAQDYTVQAGGVVTGNAVAITFSPAVQPGAGWEDNAEVSFAANTVGEVTGWEAEVSRAPIDRTVQGSEATRYTLDVPEWRGTLRAFLDYGDAEQAAVLNQLLAGSIPVAQALTLRVAPGKVLWGDALLTNGRVTSQRGPQLVEVQADFVGNGSASFDWNT